MRKGSEITSHGMKLDIVKISQNVLVISVHYGLEHRMLYRVLRRFMLKKEWLVFIKAWWIQIRIPEKISNPNMAITVALNFFYNGVGRGGGRECYINVTNLPHCRARVIRPEGTRCQCSRSGSVWIRGKSLFDDWGISHSGSIKVGTVPIGTGIGAQGNLNVFYCLWCHEIKPMFWIRVQLLSPRGSGTNFKVTKCWIFTWKIYSK